MTDTMVERVARALDPLVWAREGDYPFERSRIEAGRFTSMSQARAAIEAMREPTDAMLAAGDLPGWDDSVTVGLAGEVWRAMVDAALTPSSAPSPQLGPSENTVNSEGQQRGD